jgi:ABC-type lipoprotein export system ATPase subunit
VLLADEPTGSLDSRTGGEVMQLLQRLNQGGTTIVMVTHSEACACFAGKVLTLADGRLTGVRADVDLSVSLSDDTLALGTGVAGLVS